jgi:hypothetical protein
VGDSLGVPESHLGVALLGRVEVIFSLVSSWSGDVAGFLAWSFLREPLIGKIK